MVRTMKKPSKKLRVRLAARDGFKCFWCKKLMVFHGTGNEDNYVTIEHLIRKSEGGKSNMKNCVLACKKCNNTRHHDPSVTSGKPAQPTPVPFVEPPRPKPGRPIEDDLQRLIQ
jgi:5-methylcytosine-specific restriction endonuclease McrA